MDFRKFFTEMSGREFKTVGERMKAYENVGNVRLTPNTPVIINVDGQNFKKYASRFRDFNPLISDAMKHAVTKVCATVQNVKVAYSHSDKATFIIVDPNDQMWFDGNVQDIISMVSGLFTYHFNAHMNSPDVAPALFRTKVFQVPIHEVNNVLVWKQRTAMRNAISRLAEIQLPKELIRGKTSSAKLEMLMANKVDVSGFMVTEWHRGFCVVKEFVIDDNEAIRKRKTAWGVDLDIPVFSEDKGFVDCILKTPELKV